MRPYLKVIETSFHIAEFVDKAKYLATLPSPSLTEDEPFYSTSPNQFGTLARILTTLA